MDLTIETSLIVDETKLERMARDATSLTKRICPDDWSEMLEYLGLKEVDCVSGT